MPTLGSFTYLALDFTSRFWIVVAYTFILSSYVTRAVGLLWYIHSYTLRT